VKLLLVTIALVVATPRAGADCASDADRLRAHLVQGQHRAHRWNIAWAIAFGGAAAVQFTLAATEFKPYGTFTQDDKETLIVGGAKATIGSLSRIVTPLSVSIPAASADRCGELTALRKAVVDLGRKERATFWLTHLGGFAVNLTGALILWHRRSFKVGAASFVLALPVSPIAAYTMPRATWHLWREESPAWSVAQELGAGGR
jgi:hypothetical protein